jgi:hypothetical protein
MLGPSLAAALLASAASSPAAVEQAARPGIALESSSVESGSTVGVSWRLDGEGRGFDEMELLLSLDGGRTFPLRVTRRIDPRVRGVLWTVPSLPTANARLALRVGEDGPPEEERVVSVSADFTIVSPPGTPPERIFRVDGEERTRDALEGAPAPPLRDAMSGVSGDRIAPADSLDLPARAGPSDSDSNRESTRLDDAASALNLSPPGGHRPPHSTIRIPMRL